MIKKRFILLMSILCFLLRTTAQDSISIYTQKIQASFDNSAIVGMGAAIIIGDKIVWKQGYGFSDRATNKPFTTKTIMNIASISKTFTGVCIMKAVEEGKLSLDEDINKYLPFKVVNPHFPNEKITLRHLATHTSGLADRDPFYGEYTYVYGGKTMEPLGTFLRNYYLPDGKHYSKENFLPNKPGTFRAYSNIAAALAGYIVECVTKQTLQVYARNHIFSKLQMKGTTWSLAEVNKTEHSKLYNRDTTGAIKEIELYDGITYPDGGVRTSIESLSAFFISLLNDGVYGNKRVLKKSSVDELIKFQFTENGKPANVIPEKLNSGIFWATKMGATRMGHNGSDPGVRTFMLTDLKKEISVVIFFNTSLSDKEEGKYFDMYNAFYKLGQVIKKQMVN